MRYVRGTHGDLVGFFVGFSVLFHPSSSHPSSTHSVIFLMGLRVGFSVGLVVGFWDGFVVGFQLGFLYSFMVGFHVGLVVGLVAGFYVDLDVAHPSSSQPESTVGLLEGVSVGLVVCLLMVCDVSLSVGLLVDV